LGRHETRSLPPRPPQRGGRGYGPDPVKAFRLFFESLRRFSPRFPSLSRQLSKKDRRPPSSFPLEEYGAGCRIRTNDLRFTKPDNGFRCARTGPQWSQFGQSAATVWPTRGCALALRYGETIRGKLCPSSRALRPVHWRSQIVIAGKRCEISKALRQRSSAIRFPACQRSTGENANGPH
jgi:hypothetical protein